MANKYFTFNIKSLWKNYIQPSLWLHPAVPECIALWIPTGSWYLACTFLIARGMAKGTWWNRLYWGSSDGFIKNLRLPVPWLNYSKIWGIWFWWYYSYSFNFKLKAKSKNVISYKRVDRYFNWDPSRFYSYSSHIQYFC